MTTLMTFAKYEIGFFLAALMAVVAFQLLTGRISTRGLISEKTKAGAGAVSPARVQLLLFTLAAAVYLLVKIVASINDTPPGKPISFPDMETKWLLLLGGSHSVFLGSKGVLSLLGLPSIRQGEQ
jgi:hypothetical protein